MARQVRILIADDQRWARRGLRAALSTAGHLAVVGEAADGREALEQLEHLAPDVAIVDVHLPVFDGLHVTRASKARWPAVAILAVSIDAGQCAPALAAGADAFLAKGVQLDALLATIDAIGSQRTRCVRLLLANSP
jgi:DNA-binding NarL/FixJ family response regulator